jgi:four helix bundle protein
LANTYRDLLVWRKAKSLAVGIYRATEHFPKPELFGLTSQMRRASVSVVSNIAEGQGRGSKPDFAKFLAYRADRCSNCRLSLKSRKNSDLAMQTNSVRYARSVIRFSGSSITY